MAWFEAYSRTQHGSYAVSDKCTTQKNSLILEVYANLMEKMPSCCVVSLTTSVRE